MLSAVMILAATGGTPPPPEKQFIQLDHEVFVAMNFIVGEQGRLTSCEVAKTDAPEIFQKAACRVIMQRARVTDNGKPVAPGTPWKKTMRFSAGKHPLYEGALWEVEFRPPPGSTDTSGNQANTKH